MSVIARTLLETTPLASSPTSERWTAVGRSDSSASSQDAGREAAAQALSRPGARLALVFSAEDRDLQAVLAGVREIGGSVPVIGCTTAGEIASGGPSSASVVVMAIGGDGFSVATAKATGISSRLREAGAEVAACLAAAEPKPYRVLILLSDGLAGDQQEIVRGAFAVAGAAVPLVGGAAADNLKMVGTAQFYGDEVLRGAVVAAALTSDSPIGVGVHHSWRRTGQPMLVTHSTGSRVLSLNEEPALDVYLRGLDAPADTYTDPAAFTSFAISRPLGLSRRSGEELRCIGDANFDDRSLGCTAQMPMGAVTWFMECTAKSTLEATDQACAEALRALEGRPPVGLLAFDCVGRRDILGPDGIQAEVARISDHATGAPVAGFYTYGEIARVRGIKGFHNQSLVVLALS